MRKAAFLMVITVALMTLVAAPATTPQTPKAQPKVALPRSITLGTHSVGSVYYAVGSGLASVLTKYSGMEAVVAPHPGPIAWVAKMAAGEIEIGLVNEAESRWIYDGTAGYKSRGPSPQIRMLRIGHSSDQGVMVPAGSSIKTLADLRGKRIAYPVAGHASYNNNTLGYLAEAGLTEKDIISVPAESFTAAGRLLIEGKAEVFTAGPESAIAREIIEARGGIRFIPVYTDPKSVKIFQKIHPGRIAILQPGRPGVTEPTPCWSFDAYIAAWGTLPDIVTYQVVKTLWERYEELAPIHVELKRWTRERAINSDFSIPVHPGGVRFYKEKGVWTAEMESLQAKLLAGK
jgi:TRAP transporter TAXI family solute receptor